MQARELSARLSPNTCPNACADARRRRFWLLHAGVPAAAFAVVAVVNKLMDLDVRLAEALFFDAETQRWVGAGTWWAVDLLHTAGRDLVRVVVLLALGALAASLVVPRARHWRRGAAFVFLSLALSTGLVGALKSVTNVDCPWDLERYGGNRPHVSLFEDRPDDLPRARCFPGAHASSGFALLCFYFLLRGRSRGASLAALAGGALAGLLFSFGQEARGAHFISHDLTSAVLVWYVLLALYVALLKPGPLSSSSRASAPSGH